MGCAIATAETKLAGEFACYGATATIDRFCARSQNFSELRNHWMHLNWITRTTSFPRLESIALVATVGCQFRGASFVLRSFGRCME